MVLVKVKGKRVRQSVKIRKVGPEGRASWYVRLPPDIRKAMNLDGVDIMKIEAYPEEDVIILRPDRD